MDSKGNMSRAEVYAENQRLAAEKVVAAAEAGWRESLERAGMTDEDS